MTSMDLDAPLGCQLYTLPEEALRTVAQHASAMDVCHLAKVCRSLRWLAKDDTVWRSKYVDVYGDVDTVKEHLDAAGLAPHVSLAASSEPTIEWWQRYAERYQVARDVDHDEEADELHAQTTLQANGECYYLLAFICYVANAFRPALALLEMGRDADDTYTPIDELEAEVIQLVEKAEGTGDDVPLLAGRHLSDELARVLTDIFQGFDQDGDQHLSLDELDAFIFFSNGQHAPREFLQHFAANYGADAGRLTLDGFLAFFLQQTLDDPEETRKDLAKHGWNGRTLQKEPASAL
ncbi:hypothetical protein THASP1DRAFT_22282 [Thamnocephalis sphaerospora]|uniref:Calmodulin n=1 Tax=Thamnocephalis sphaerospora TaxID=78915 RepID=A0A4P9XUP2_9FUNG|nr:hypothetical protein THASP1DRAFT_22282 [Thamnocephalis sphaerospora]|eukprot:RKP09954.1 hypothetical protein THASP1DRAFT_22282 [Thamnocephalis sphaerospora]